jgi:hypothetical protein
MIDRSSMTGSLKDKGAVRRQHSAVYSIFAYASEDFRVTAGSTGMPGPVVVETVIFFR